MGIRGRKPVPVSLRLVKGNPGRRALPAPAEPPRRSELVCPPDVAGDELAAGFWRLYAAGARHLQVIDGPLLALLVKALSRANRIERQLGNEFLVRRRGGTAKNPLTSALNGTIDLARKLSADLALTPPERARLNVREAPPADPAEKYFNG